MANRKYTDEEFKTAVELLKTLQEFTNKDLQCMINHKVLDSTRNNVIAEILVNEYGDDILTTGIFNPFGEDKLSKKTSYRVNNA